MTPTTLLIIGALTVIAGGIAIFLGVRSASGDEINRRLINFTTEDNLPQQRWNPDTAIRRPELTGSFTTRTVVPMFRRLGKVFGQFTPTGSIEGLNRDLVAAGKPLNLGAREFYGIRLLFMLLGGLLAFLIVRQGREMINLVGAIFALFAGFYFPRTWLKRLVRRRQERIKRSLPDALDMLSVCADAGLGFDQSLQRVSENWRTALGSEFAQVVKEMNLGLGRETALRNLANRLDVPELSSFVAVIVQSDHLGMSIAETLHGQANQMRIERRYWAQEMARKIPIKMLFPLVFLILPALFIVVLGPALPALVEVLQKVGK